MLVYDKIRPEELDRRELQLTLLACSTILILGAGLALLMYPVVFSRSNAPTSMMLRNAFYGFCTLSALLAMYLVDRQMTILRLRRQIAEDRRRAAESRIEASAELLNADSRSDLVQGSAGHGIPPGGGRDQVLSVLVITVKLPEDVASTPTAISRLSDAAKAISRKLREQDSVYVLRPPASAPSFPTLPAPSPSASPNVLRRGYPMRRERPIDFPIRSTW